MPPKRKPTVVGTVSTRSTRRQSIVNIEIPRLKKPKSQKKGKKADAKTEGKKASNSEPESDNNDDKEVFEASTSSTVVSPNKAVVDILNDWTDDRAEIEEVSQHSSNESIEENVLEGANEIVIQQDEVGETVVQYVVDTKSYNEVPIEENVTEEIFISEESSAPSDNDNVQSAEDVKGNVSFEVIISEESSSSYGSAIQTSHSTSSVENIIFDDITRINDKKVVPDDSVCKSSESVPDTVEVPSEDIEVQNEEVEVPNEEVVVPIEEIQNTEQVEVVSEVVIDDNHDVILEEAMEEIHTSTNQTETEISNQVEETVIEDTVEDGLKKMNLESEIDDQKIADELEKMEVDQPEIANLTVEEEKLKMDLEQEKLLDILEDHPEDLPPENTVKEEIKMETDDVQETTHVINDINADTTIEAKPESTDTKTEAVPTTEGKLETPKTVEKTAPKKKQTKKTETPKKQPNKKSDTEKKPKTKKTPGDKPPKKPVTKAKKEPTKVKQPSTKKATEKSPKEPKPNKKSKKKTEKEDTPKPKDEDDEESNEIRRSSRIKSISVVQKKTKGLVKSKSDSNLAEGENSENSNSGFTDSEKSTPTASPMPKERPVSSKTRSKSTENVTKDLSFSDLKLLDVKPKPTQDKVVEARLKQFVHLKENLYKTDRMACKEAKKMVCDCFLTQEEIDDGEYGCGDDCLNRLLMIECGPQCSINDRCTNKRFQKGQFAPVEVFNTEKKGLGLRAAANIPYGEFILEYVGEVLDPDQFEERAEHYSTDKNIHYYFMSLRADAIIDATMKGNISRFINHSCDPNAETQKWTVNGELRIGFFSTRTIFAGEEITFDYRFQRYGKEAQKCYCEASICRGWLGERPDSSDEEEEEEEEEEDEEEEEQPAALPTTVPEEVVIEEKVEVPQVVDTVVPSKTDDVVPPMESQSVEVLEEVKVEEPVVTPVVKPEKKSPKMPKKKARKEMFEDLDQLEEEIEMLVETGLKNQAHTLKLSRLMVRAKEISQRAKILRVLRRGELACRRLFLDYHGLRLMHGYMIDAQQPGKIYEQSRLEMLQTLAVLPIPNKTMLQDSKVLPTVEKWSMGGGIDSPGSNSNSPKDEEETQKAKKRRPNEELAEKREDEPKLQEEIVALALKLIEEWTVLKEVFRIPKKERIEQMKEHEREANRKYNMMNAEQEANSRFDNKNRFVWSKKPTDKDLKKKMDEKERALSMYKITKQERRKLFALQVELREEERRRKQREMWRLHEQNCLIIGADPRLTAPFDPSRGFQYVWNPQTGQWQNIPIPSENNMFGTSKILSTPPPPLPNLSVPPPQLAKPSYSYNLPMPPLPTISQQPHIPFQQPQTPTSINPSVSVPYPTQPPLPTIPPPVQTTVTNTTYQEPIKRVEENVTQVKFMGPIPPPAKLPPKWKCAKDKYGRPYYYHVKIRKSQWEPPPYVEPQPEPEESSESSSTESSSVSSDSSTENSDSDDEIDDTRLLMEVKKQMEKSAKLTNAGPSTSSAPKTDNSTSPSPEDKESDNNGSDSTPPDDDENKPTSIDIRLKEQFNLLSDDKPTPPKKRRTGLVQQIIISPRTEEDRLQFREDLKRYKYNKEKLKREREMVIQQTRKQLRETEAKTTVVKVKEKKARTPTKIKIKEMPDFNSEASRKIKETFRTNMATTVVSVLNAYRKPDCTEGRIVNTDDFKHLARKLTHFVMLKEMKHISKIEELTCTDNVKTKAREYIRKYMGKFGEVYQKRPDEPDFKD